MSSTFTADITSEVTDASTFPSNETKATVQPNKSTPASSISTPAVPTEIPNIITSSSPQRESTSTPAASIMSTPSYTTDSSTDEWSVTPENEDTTFDEETTSSKGDPTQIAYSDLIQGDP